ncbi:MAG: ABC transporter substrate-binding protein [Spirochaeta sp. LUC14_002_19_P3]|nr:MAG: ABC transporter substrate-binding protein [Spirochaeta sp. LUC14_002_19_P3]
MAEREIPPNPAEKVNAEGIILTHAISLRSEARYPADFTHFDYVNPQAPKGGTLTMAAIGTFDSFHRYAQRGDMSPYSESFYDSLLISSEDEIEVYYGLIAEKMEYSPAYNWIIYHIRPEARHQDGAPIRAEDIVFSFYKFMEEGVPQFRQYYSNVKKVEALDDSRVKFTLGEGSKELLISLGSIPVLPPQYWRSRNFSEPSTEIPLGSGAYTVSDYSMGQYIVYERLKDYWGRNLPVNRGQHNFDYIRYDMYRDETVQLEAFKAGEVDFRQENIAKQWATQYTGPNFDAGYILKASIPDNTPPGLQALVFNTKRTVFADLRVRKAVSYALDFEWLNRSLFYGQYTRTRSLFQGTPFEALGLPSEEELAILEPIRTQVPEEVFTQEYQPPVTDGSGRIREQIQLATSLLEEAGWAMRNQKIVNTQSGEHLEFECLIYNSSSERIIIPIKENLARMGITLNIRLTDPTQYINRVREGDYDITVRSIPSRFYPNIDYALYWHSKYLDSSYNYSRVSNPALDYLLDGIAEHQNDNQTLAHWARALDRVIMWNHYLIPEWHISSYRIAYWDKFSMPETRPLYSLGTGTWWFDTEKAARLPSAQH